jgi:sugar phosphate isomerase/epimerase
MIDYRISFQLYSARKFPPIEAQLERLAAIGYDAVEPYRGAYGDDPAGFRKKLDAVGLACPSAHIGLDGLDADRAAAVDTAKTLGLELVIIPAVPQDQRTQAVDGWKALAGKLSDHAAHLAEAGLKLAWHNHDFEYRRLADGSRPIDHLLAAKGVLWEPDIGWIVRAGEDAAAEMTKYADRIACFHVKDLAPDGVTADDGWTDVGAGTIDWQVLWPVMVKTGAGLLVMEHDEPSDWQSFASHSYDFVANLTGRED